MIKMSNHKISFAACCAGESVYQTVQLNNTSDTPVQFKILQDSSGTYKSFPSLGQVPGKSFSLVTFEFNPQTPRFYNFSAQFVFNNSSANIQSCLLQGYCYGPQISLPQEKLFYPPTIGQVEKACLKHAHLHTGPRVVATVSLVGRARVGLHYLSSGPWGLLRLC